VARRPERREDHPIRAVCARSGSGATRPVSAAPEDYRSIGSVRTSSQAALTPAVSDGLSPCLRRPRTGDMRPLRIQRWSSQGEVVVSLNTGWRGASSMNFSIGSSPLASKYGAVTGTLRT